MDDLNLYDDLDEFQEQQENKSKELQAAEDKFQQSLKTIEEVKEENKALKKNIQRIELGFQSLLDTARSEIKRKNKEIERLRKEKDDICFRRKIPTKYANSEKDAHLHNNYVANNPFKHNDARISLPETVVAAVCEENKEKPETNKRNRVTDGITACDAKRHRGNLTDYDDKNHYNSYKHRKTDQKNGECHQDGRSFYRESDRSKMNKDYGNDRVENEKSYRNKYEKSSRFSERNESYRKDSRKSRSRERDKLKTRQKNIEKKPHSQGCQKTRSFSKSYSKSPPNGNNFKRMESTNESNDRKTEAENSKKNLLREENITNSPKSLATENLHMENDNKSKNEKQNSEKPNMETKHISKEEKQKKVTTEIQVQNKCDNGCNNNSENKLKNGIPAKESDKLSTTRKVALFNEIFGKSPNEYGSTSTNSAKSNTYLNNIKRILEKNSEIEVISSATTSPGDYTDVDSCATTPISISSSSNASGKVESSVNIETKSKSRDDIDDCFILNAATEHNFKTIACVDLTNNIESNVGNEIDLIQIPGLDLWFKNKETDEENISNLEPHDNKVTKATKETSIPGFNDELTDFNKTKLVTKLNIVNCDIVDKNQHALIPDGCAATDKKGLLHEICNPGSEIYNNHKKSTTDRNLQSADDVKISAASNCGSVLLDKQDTTTCETLTIQKAEQLPLKDNEFVGIETKQCGSGEPLKNPFKTTENEQNLLSLNKLTTLTHDNSSQRKDNEECNILSATKSFYPQAVVGESSATDKSKTSNVGHDRGHKSDINKSSFETTNERESTKLLLNDEAIIAHHENETYFPTTGISSESVVRKTEICPSTEANPNDPISQLDYQVEKKPVKVNSALAVKECAIQLTQGLNTANVENQMAGNAETGKLKNVLKDTVEIATSEALQTEGEIPQKLVFEEDTFVSKELLNMGISNACAQIIESSAQKKSKQICTKSDSKLEKTSYDESDNGSDCLHQVDSTNKEQLDATEKMVVTSQKEITQTKTESPHSPSHQEPDKPQNESVNADKMHDTKISAKMLSVENILPSNVDQKKQLNTAATNGKKMTLDKNNKMNATINDAAVSLSISEKENLATSEENVIEQVCEAPNNFSREANALNNKNSKVVVQSVELLFGSKVVQLEKEKYIRETNHNIPCSLSTKENLTDEEKSHKNVEKVNMVSQGNVEQNNKDNLTCTTYHEDPSNLSENMNNADHSVRNATGNKNLVPTTEHHMSLQTMNLCSPIKTVQDDKLFSSSEIKNQIEEKNLAVKICPMKAKILKVENLSDKTKQNSTINDYENQIFIETVSQKKPDEKNCSSVAELDLTSHCTSVFQEKQVNEEILNENSKTIESCSQTNIDTNLGDIFSTSQRKHISHLSQESKPQNKANVVIVSRSNEPLQDKTDQIKKALNSSTNQQVHEMPSEKSTIDLISLKEENLICKDGIHIIDDSISEVETNLNVAETLKYNYTKEIPKDDGKLLERCRTVSSSKEIPNKHISEMLVTDKQNIPSDAGQETLSNSMKISVNDNHSSRESENDSLMLSVSDLDLIVAIKETETPNPNEQQYFTPVLNVTPNLSERELVVEKSEENTSAPNALTKSDEAFRSKENLQQKCKDEATIVMTSETCSIYSSANSQNLSTTIYGQTVSTEKNSCNGKTFRKVKANSLNKISSIEATSSEDFKDGADNLANTFSSATNQKENANDLPSEETDKDKVCQLTETEPIQKNSKELKSLQQNQLLSCKTTTVVSTKEACAIKAENGKICHESEVFSLAIPAEPNLKSKENSPPLAKKSLSCDTNQPLVSEISSQTKETCVTKTSKESILKASIEINAEANIKNNLLDNKIIQDTTNNFTTRAKVCSLLEPLKPSKKDDSTSMQTHDSKDSLQTVSADSANSQKYKDIQRIEREELTEKHADNSYFKAVNVLGTDIKKGTFSGNHSKEMQNLCLTSFNAVPQTSVTREEPAVLEQGNANKDKENVSNVADDSKITATTIRSNQSLPICEREDTKNKTMASLHNSHSFMFGEEKPNHTSVQNQLSAHHQVSCSTEILSLPEFKIPAAEITNKDQLLNDTTSLQTLATIQQTTSKVNEMTPLSFSVNNGNLSQTVAESKKIIFLKKIVTKEINIEGEIVEVVKDIVDFSEILHNNSNIITENPRDVTVGINETDLKCHSLQPQIETQTAIIPNPAESLSTLPSIPTALPTPSNFSGIFSKTPSAMTISDEDLYKSKKKSAHLSNKPKEYILPAASVLCNVDNLANATNANKKLHWELLDNKNEMTEIEDDVDIDTTDEDELKIKEEPLTNVLCAIKPNNLQNATTEHLSHKSLPSETDTQTEDESLLNDVKQQQGKYKTLKQTITHTIKTKMPKNIKAGLEAIAMHNENDIVDNVIAIQKPIPTATYKRPVGRPRKLDKKLKISAKQIQLKKGGQPPKNIVNSNKVEAQTSILLSSKLDNYKNQTILKEDIQKSELIESSEVERNHEILQLQTSPNKCTKMFNSNSADNNTNYLANDERNILDLNNIENSVKSLSNSVEKLEICGEPCSLRDSFKQRKSFEDKIVDSRNKDSNNTLSIYQKQHSLNDGIKTSILTGSNTELNEKVKSQLSSVATTENVSLKCLDKVFGTSLKSKENQDQFCNKNCTTDSKPKLLINKEKNTRSSISINTINTQLNSENRAASENNTTSRNSSASSEEQPKKSTTPKNITKHLLKKKMPSNLMNNKVKSCISLEDIGINVRPPKFHLSSYRIPKLKKKPEDIIDNMRKLETYVETETVEDKKETHKNNEQTKFSQKIKYDNEKNVKENCQSSLTLKNIQTKSNSVELTLEKDVDLKTGKEVEHNTQSPCSSFDVNCDKTNAGRTKLLSDNKSADIKTTKAETNIFEISKSQSTKPRRKSFHFSYQVTNPESPQTKSSTISANPLKKSRKAPQRILDESRDNIDNVEKKENLSTKEFSSTAQNSISEVSLLQEQTIAANNSLRVRRKSIYVEEPNLEGDTIAKDEKAKADPRVPIGQKTTTNETNMPVRLRRKSLYNKGSNIDEVRPEDLIEKCEKAYAEPESSVEQKTVSNNFELSDSKTNKCVNEQQSKTIKSFKMLKRLFRASKISPMQLEPTTDKLCTHKNLRENIEQEIMKNSNDVDILDKNVPQEKQPSSIKLQKKSTTIPLDSSKFTNETSKIKDSRNGVNSKGSSEQINASSNVQDNLYDPQSRRRKSTSQRNKTDNNQNSVDVNQTKQEKIKESTLETGKSNAIPKMESLTLKTQNKSINQSISQCSGVGINNNSKLTSRSMENSDGSLVKNSYEENEDSVTATETNEQLRRKSVNQRLTLDNHRAQHTAESYSVEEDLLKVDVQRNLAVRKPMSQLSSDTLLDITERKNDTRLNFDANQNLHTNSTPDVMRTKDIKEHTKSLGHGQNLRPENSLNQESSRNEQKKLKSTTNRCKILESSSEDEPVIKKPNLMTSSVEIALKAADKPKQRKRRLVKVLSTSMDSPSNSTNTSQPSPYASPLFNHPIFNNDISTQSTEFTVTLPMTPNQQDDSKLKEIDSKLNELFQSPAYRTSYENLYSVSPTSDVSLLPQALNNSQPNVTEDETIDLNQENDRSSLNVPQINNSTISVNDSQTLHSSSEVKHVSLGSAEYRFEKVSDNVVNLFISRKRKRKAKN